MPAHNGHSAIEETTGNQPGAAPSAEATSSSGPAVYNNVQAFSIVAEQDAAISQSGAAILIVGDDLHLTQSGAGILIAGENVQISQGGCGFLIAGGDVTIVEGDTAKFQAVGGALHTDYGSMLLAAREAHIHHSSVGVVLAGKALLDENTHVTLNVSFYELAGAFVGLAFLLPLRLLQRLGAKAGARVNG